MGHSKEMSAVLDEKLIWNVLGQSPNLYVPVEKMSNYTSFLLQYKLTELFDCFFKKKRLGRWNIRFKHKYSLYFSSRTKY